MSSTSSAKKLLLVGWDAADWKVITPLLDAGHMPNLARLVEGGVMGNLATLRPCLSPILWTSVATGKLADKHGILGFIEPTPDGAGVRLSSSTSRKTKALWNILSQNGLKTHAIAWYASHPAEPINGVCVSDQFMGTMPAQAGQPWPAPPGSIHPPELVDPISKLRIHTGELRATDLSPFIPKLPEIDPNVDLRPGKLALALAKNSSVHAIATAVLDAEPWDVMCVYYDALDVVGHDFMIYHPPRMANVSLRDFELYSGVMNGLYQFHDMMLGRLMEMAGDDAAIVLVSDHGFHSDHLRPATIGRDPLSEETAAAWHRHYGVLAMRGPGLKRDERVYGANLLDVTPTVLTILGLPVGQDMDGRTLIESFDPAVEIRKVRGWDEEQGPASAGMHPPDLRQDPFLSAEAIEQLIALGYLPEPARDQKLACEVARREAKFNLAATHLFVGRAGQAREILVPLCEANPDQPRYRLWLAKSQAALGEHQQCRETVEAIHAKHGRNADTDLLLTAAMFNAGDADSADALLRDIEQRYPPTAALYQLIGGIHQSQHRWADAERAFEKAVSIDEDNEQAYSGLSKAMLEQGKFEDAAEHALRAVGLVHFFPAAHFQLGAALEGMGELERAITSLEVCVAMAPGHLEAHRRLAQMYSGKGDTARALQHERQSQGYGASPPPNPRRTQP